MRILRIGIMVAAGLGVLGLDVGASLRTGALTQTEAHAKRHKKRHRKHAHHRHHKHHHAPAQQM